MTPQFCRSARALILVIVSAVVLQSCSSKSPTSPSPVAAAPAPAPVPAPPPPAPSKSPAETYSTTTVSFSSDQGHSVGQGKSITLTPQDATFDVQLSPNGGHLFVEMRVKNSTPLSFWLFHIMTPNSAATKIASGTYDTGGDPLSPAVFFLVGGDGHACTSTARLVIHSFEVAPGTSTLRNFRASFDNLHCNGSSPSMRGEIAILDPWK